MSHPLKGKNIFIRTVTMYFTGKVEKVTRRDYVLSSAAWIPDMGRFTQALAKGDLPEVEPYPDDAMVRVNREGVIDVTTWKHKLPREQR